MVGFLFNVDKQGYSPDIIIVCLTSVSDGVDLCFNVGGGGGGIQTNLI